MALNFPSSPTIGQQYENFVWDGASWLQAQTLPGGLPAGSIIQWGGSTAPANWLLCDGSVVSRTTYASLFAAIGTIYGAGDGSSTFQLPDLRGRVAVGRNGGSFGSLGATGGVESVTLTAAQSGSPAHSHTFSGSTNTTGAHTHSLNGKVNVSQNGYGQNSPINGNAGNFADGSALSAGDHAHTFSGTTGNSTAVDATASHTNVQPYQVVNYIIKATAAATPGDSELATRVQPVTLGGTGSTSLSAGSYLKGNGTNAVAVQSGVPATDLTGTINSARLPTIPIANGGTGVTVGAGLVPIVPSSVSLNSGTATVSATGLISFTGANTATINDIFSSAYSNYKIVITSEADSSPSDIWLQFRNSGGTLGSGYNYMRFNNQNNALSGSYSTSQGSWNLGRTNGYGGTAIDLTLYDPGKNLTASNGYRKYISHNTDAVFSEMLSGVNGITGSAYTSCLIFLSGAVTFGTAKIQVYGYR